MVTPLSFRARLGRATYVDATSKKAIGTRYSIFIEHENEVARRFGGRIVELPRIVFNDLDGADADADDAVRVHDRQHRLLDLGAAQRPPRPGSARAGSTRSRTTSICPASSTRPTRSPDPRIGIRSVLDRLYRGPCRTIDEFEAAASAFRAKRGDMLALIDSMATSTATPACEAKEYLESFFRSIEKPDAIKKQFVDGCKPAPTM